MGVSKNSGTPKWMVYSGKPYHNRWLRGTPIFGNSHIYLRPNTHILFQWHLPCRSCWRLCVEKPLSMQESLRPRKLDFEGPKTAAPLQSHRQGMVGTLGQKREKWCILCPSFPEDHKNHIRQWKNMKKTWSFCILSTGRMSLLDSIIAIQSTLQGSLAFPRSQLQLVGAVNHSPYRPPTGVQRCCLSSELYRA